MARPFGGAVLVTGEAGIGKTAVITECARVAAARGTVVLTGRAVEGGGPLRAISEALYGAGTMYRQVLDSLLQPWNGCRTNSVAVLGEGVLRLLRQVAGEDGCLLVLDDLQWADEDTMRLLQYVVPILVREKVAVLLAARAGAGSVDHLSAISSVTSVLLPRLTDDEARELAARNGSELCCVVDKAEGLPLLVELLAADRGTAPFATLVHRTIARLPRMALRVLDAAAVLGRTFDWRLVAAATGLTHADVAAGLRSAVDVQMLEQGESFAWRHGMYRRVVLDGLLDPERAVLAGRAADALLGRGEELTRPDVTVAAKLFAYAGRTEQAAEVHVQAARRAFAAGAPRDAEESLRHAAILRDGPEVAIERVRQLAMTGNGEEALRIGAPALLGAKGETRLDLCLALARAAVTAARWRDARGFLARAGAPDDPRVVALQADAAFGTGDLHQARSLAVRAADEALSAGFPEVACEALEVVARCDRTTDPAAAVAAFARAADIAEANGLLPWRVRALFGLGTVELLTNGSSARLAEVSRLACGAGMLAEAAGIELILGDAIKLVDGPPAAFLRAQRSAELARRMNLAQIEAMATTLVAEAEFANGRTAEGEAALSHAACLAPDFKDVVAAGHCSRAMRAFTDWDLTRTRDELDLAIAALGGHGSAAPLPYWGLWALVRTHLGDRGAAARDELRGSPMLMRLANRGGLAYADAVAAGHGGRPEEAQRHVALGDEILKGQPWLRRVMKLIVWESMVAGGWGDPVMGLRQDLAAFDEAGQIQFARRCRELFRRAGVPVPRRGRGDSTVPPNLRALGVTSRETDVLALVVRGLTNAQIAARLFLSTRTVDTHVANLLAKTGTPARGGLGRHLVA